VEHWVETKLAPPGETVQATPHPIVSFKFWLVFTKVILCKKCMMNFGIGMVRGVWEEVCQFSFLSFLSFFSPCFFPFFSPFFFSSFFSPPPCNKIRRLRRLMLNLPFLGIMMLAPSFHMPVAHVEPETFFVSLLHWLRMWNRKPF